MFASAGIFNSQWLTTIGLFGAFAAVAWWVMDLMVANKPRAIERLDELKNPRARRSSQAEAMLKKPDTMARMLEKTSALVKPLQPKDANQAGLLRDRLAAAGFRSEGMVAIFMGLKVIGLCAGLFLGGGTVLTLRGMNQTTMLYTGVLVGVFFWLPDVVLGLIGGSRKQAIFLALPDALDMMVVCVEAGLGLDQAMRKVSEEMKSSYPVLSEEFALTNFQLQMGRTRADALRELGARCGVSDLRALAGVLIQADKFGSGIAQALRTQSEAMRTRRRQIAEEKAAKTAVKLIFPLVIFIFPGIFVILVGPAAIHMVRDMFPKMSGG